MSVKTFSISMGERAYRQARAEADRAGLSMSAWMTRAAREKIQRDAASVQLYLQETLTALAYTGEAVVALAPAS